MASRLAAITLLAFLLTSQSTARSPFPQGATILHASMLTAFPYLHKVEQRLFQSDPQWPSIWAQHMAYYVGGVALAM